MASRKLVLFILGLASISSTTPEWTQNVEEANSGHTIGNPDAEVKLAEYISYTCSHCATFTKEGESALKQRYVQDGTVSLEIRHLIRDPIDLTVALLTHCGEPESFSSKHTAFMASQDNWLAIAIESSADMRQRWSNPDREEGRRALSEDLGFYEIMRAHSYTTTEINSCLADGAQESALINSSMNDARRLNLRGTPSFTINDALLPNIHRWEELEPRIIDELASNLIGSN